MCETLLKVAPCVVCSSLHGYVCVHIAREAGCSAGASRTGARRDHVILSTEVSDCCHRRCPKKFEEIVFGTSGK
jgi:hypothetical protein